MKTTTPPKPTPRPMPAWAAGANRLVWRTLEDPSGDGGVRLNTAIDAHKVLTGPLVLALMIAFDVFTLPAWIYLGLHGSYGVAWVVKDRTFPDRQWQRPVGWGAAVVVWIFLSFYWVAPTILVLGTAGVLGLEGWAPASPAGLGVAVFLYALGLLLMVGSDIQKNLTIALRPGGELGPGLITTGFYARTRHPNYLGEMMIYASFALLVGHWLPWLLLAAVWVVFFVPNMLAIDASLSRYPEYEAWRERTGFVLPRVRP